MSKNLISELNRLISSEYIERHIRYDFISISIIHFY